MRCTSGYVTFPACSPSRAGTLTGCYQARFGHENNPVYDPLDDKEGLPLTEKLLPQYFQEAGYRTGWIGKWHFGAAPAFAPWKHGFDESFGFIGGGHRFIGWKPNENQYTLPLIRNGAAIDEVPPHLTSALGDEAAGFVRRNILAGQSNMQGHAKISPIEHIGMDPATKPMLAEMLDAEGKLKPAEEKSEIEKLRMKDLTERERLVLEKGISNQELHYLGSAKILGGIGKDLAESMAELKQL